MHPARAGWLAHQAGESGAAEQGPRDARAIGSRRGRDVADLDRRGRNVRAFIKEVLSSTSQSAPIVARAAILSLLVVTHLSPTAAIGASKCDQVSTVAASHLRLALSSQNSMDHSADEERCRAYVKHFVEAVAVRQSVATCEDTVDRRRALEALDVEIEKVNDRIAEQSCGQ